MRKTKPSINSFLEHRSVKVSKSFIILQHSLRNLKLEMTNMLWAQKPFLCNSCVEKNFRTIYYDPKLNVSCPTKKNFHPFPENYRIEKHFKYYVKGVNSPTRCFVLEHTLKTSSGSDQLTSKPVIFISGTTDLKFYTLM